MIVYHDVSRREATREKIQRLRRLAGEGDTTSFLVEFGELEQALLDAWTLPGPDRWDERAERLRSGMIEAAGAFLAGIGRGGEIPESLGAVARLAQIERAGVPERIRVLAPEGFVHYALDPAAYAVAASMYRREAGADRAAQAVVIGLRTIGATLSAIVAAEIGAKRGCTVRPRKHGHTRQILADNRLEATVRRWTRQGADVLIVDEGPGITGETFAAAAEWIRGLGVPDERIILFPSRVGGMELAPPDRREWFRRARKYPQPAEDRRAHELAAAFGLDGLQDLSAGGWRAVVPGGAGEPAAIFRERVKFRGRRGRGEWHQLRYVGLARWGEDLVRRASALAEAGLGPEPEGAESGFILTGWVPGRVVNRREACRDPDFVAAVERYLSGRAPLFPTGEAVALDPVVEMLVENATDALGAGPEGLDAAVRRLQRLPEREAVIPDARMRAREWIRSESGYAKVDALDHGAGIWFPGAADLAWDIAAAAVEFGLDDAGIARLAAACARSAGDDPAVLAEAAAAYRPAYAACNFAEAALAAREAPEPEDRRRLEAEAAGYRVALRTAILEAAAREPRGIFKLSLRGPADRCRGVSDSAPRSA